MSYCWRHFGFPIAGLAESAASMQRTVRRTFPGSVVIQDANAVDAAALQPPSSSDSVSNSEHATSLPVRPPVKIASVYGGIPCQPIAPSGAARGIDDPRIGDTTDALPRATRALDANSADAENHANIITINGGAVLAKLTENFGPDYELVDVSYVNVALYYAPEERNRVALRWEHRRMRRALGPCPPLFILRNPQLCIRDVLLPLAEVSPDAWVDGRVVRRARTAKPQCGAHVVADLHIDAATPIRAGSRVHYGGLGGRDFTVKQLSADGSTAKLFYDVRGEEFYLDTEPIGELRHLPQTIPLLSIDGAATAFTRFGAGFAGNRKQLWLRNGRAYLPHDKELTRLHELCDVAAETYDAVNAGRGAMSSGEAAGNGISMRMCESQAARASLRERRLQNCVSAQRALDSTTTCHLHRACITALATVEPWPDVGTYIVFLRTPTNGPPLALVGADLVSLPLLERRSNRKDARSSAVPAADSFVTSALREPPVCFLACDDPDARVVSCPLLGAASDDNSAEASPCAGLAWRSQAALAGSPLYDLVAAALAHTGTFMHHGAAAIAVNATRGARPLRPFARGALPPTLCCGAWPKQLQYAEAVDARFRQLLSSPTKVPELVRAAPDVLGYLREWADRVDPSHTASLPEGLQGRPPDFSDARLLELPFAFVDGGVPTTDFIAERDCPPAQPATTYRPRNVSPDIISVGAARRLGVAIRANLADLAAMANPATGGTYRRTARVCVIAQSEFHERARDIVWDTSKMLYDELGGYFAPADFSAPIGTHLATDRIFDELGDDFADQQLRHMIRTGIVFVPKPSLDMVVSPHLLSLANGFGRVDSELKRLATPECGYLEYVETLAAHVATLDDNDIALSFGRVPCICGSQGTVERKLELGRPRRIEDAGQPRKKTRNADRELIASLNDQMGVELLDDDGERLVPYERKPRIRDAMRDNAILQFAARIWGEPVVAFGDDASDYFNQFHLHPSQLHLTTILWRSAATGNMQHIMEISMGFGQRLSSNFANRFTFALCELLMRRVDAIEDVILDGETDPSRRAWIARRRALSARTGRNECRLYSLAAYTDDFKFQVVGIERAMRIMAVWYQLTRELNLRMAIPAKREAGTSTLWLGLRGYATLGYEVIPRTKQSRAVAMLMDIREQRGTRNDEYQQLRGFLQHLVPFSLGTCAMYHMHAPATAAAHLGPAGWMSASDEMLAQVTVWITTLVNRPGVSVLVAVSELETGPTDDEATSATLWEMSSDAAKDGTDHPAIAGYMHGASWAIPLRPCDVVGPLQISIPVLEFLAIVINFLVFGNRIPTGVRIVVMSDSLTSVDVLADGTAHAPLMQWLHTRLLADDHFRRLAPLALIGHGFGESNVMGDARSRGYDDLVARLCAALRVRHVPLDAPSSALELLDALRAEHYALLGAVDGTRPLDDDNSEPTANSTKRRAVDPVGNGVRIGEAENEGPTPSPTPAAASRSLAHRGWDVTLATHGSPSGARGSPTPPAPRRRAHGNSSPTVPLSRISLSPAGASAPNAVPTPPAARGPRAASPTPLFGARLSHAPGPPLVRPIAVRAGIPTPPAAMQSRTLHAAAPSPRRASPLPAVPPLPPRHPPPSQASAAAGDAALVANLRADESTYALRPADPHFLASMAAAVSGAVDAGVPVRSLRQDNRRWAEWTLFCEEFMGTGVMRPDSASISHDADALAREQFLLAAFVIWRYGRMLPRSNASPQAKPSSVRPYVDTVRNVHARRGITLAGAPVVSRVIKGLLKTYVRVHGTDALIPTRKEPITNRHCVAIYDIGRSAPARVGRHVVSWRLPRYRCFKALLNGLRQTGSRKADLLPVTPAEFDLSHVTRSHARWLIHGEIVVDPTPAQLRSLRPGDRLLFKPGASKADQLALTFGDKDIVLNWHDDDLNFPRALAELELALPVRGAARKNTPMFTIDDTHAAMSHAFADDLFRALAEHALGGAVANTLSLHGGRIFLAVALRARGYSVDMIKAICRWKTDASAVLYARLLQDEHAAAVDLAMRATITPTLIATTRRDCVIDNDHCVQRASGAHDARARAAARAASPSGPPSRTAANEDNDASASSGSDDDSDGEADGVVVAGPPVDADSIGPGDAVAVRFNSPGGSVKAYGGFVVRVMARTVRVKFRGCAGYETFDVKTERVLTIAP